MESEQLAEQAYALTCQPVKGEQDHADNDNCAQDDHGVVDHLLTAGPNDLLELALHFAEPFADSLEEARLSIVLLNGGDGFCGGFAYFLFFSHFRASFQNLLGLNVLGVLSAEGAILATLQTVSGVLLVLDRVVVPLLAFIASECDFYSCACSHSFGTSYFIYPDHRALPPCIGR